jgi:hypothetical protein
MHCTKYCFFEMILNLSKILFHFNCCIQSQIPVRGNKAAELQFYVAVVVCDVLMLMCLFSIVDHISLALFSCV